MARNGTRETYYASDEGNGESIDSPRFPPHRMVIFFGGTAFPHIIESKVVRVTYEGDGSGLSLGHDKSQ